MKTEVIDMDKLKDQAEPLSEDQNEAIRQNAFKAMRKKEADLDADDDDDPFKESLDDKDELEDHHEETDEEKKDREEAEEQKRQQEEQEREEQEKAEKAKKIEEAKAKKEEELTDDDKALIQEADEAQKKLDEEELSSYANEYAEKHGLNSDQAKAEVEKIYEVLDKYKKNPREMAQALYHLNVKLTGLGNELSQIKNQPKEGELVVKGKKLSKEESREFLIKTYRESEPELTEGMDDDKVYQIAWKRTQELFQGKRQQFMTEQKDKADQKRREVLESIADEDKAFVKDVRAVLERAGDTEVLSEGFSVKDYLYWARGKNYHTDIKKAVEKSVAEALKNKKIVQSNAGSTGAGSGKGSKKGGEGAADLTEEDKEKALEMYQSLQLPDDEKYKLYKKFKESITKKDKK